MTLTLPTTTRSVLNAIEAITTNQRADIPNEPTRKTIAEQTQAINNLR